MRRHANRPWRTIKRLGLALLVVAVASCGGKAAPPAASAPRPAAAKPVIGV